MSISQQPYRTRASTMDGAKSGYLSDRITDIEASLQNIYDATTNGGGGGFAFPYLDSVPPEFLNHLIFYNTEDGGQTASKLELTAFGDNLNVPAQVIVPSIDNPANPLSVGPSSTLIPIGYSGSTVTILGNVIAKNLDVAPNTEQDIGHSAALMKLGKSNATTTIDFQNNSCINVAGFPDATTLASAGGTSIVYNGTGPSLRNKGISAGTGISVSDLGTTVQITSTVSGSSLSGTSAGTTIVYNGSSPNFQTKDLQSTSTVTVNDGGTYLSFDVAASAVTLNSTGAGVSLLYSSPQYSPTMYIKSIEAGTGISVTDVSGSQLRIDSTISGTTLSGAGSGYQTLVYNGSAPNFQTIDVQAGQNTSIVNNGSYLTWNSFVYDTGAGGVSLVSGNQYIKPLVASFGCTITDMGTYVTISVP